MVVAIHQPNFLPWLGYFHKVAHSDVFVVLDEVQYIKGSYCNRTKIKNNQGREAWLTMPVNYQFGQLFSQVPLANRVRGIEKAVNTLKEAYQKAPFYEEYAPDVIGLLEKKQSNIFELNFEAFKWVMSQLNISTEVILQSSFNKDFGFKNELVVDICKELQATEYLSGTGAKKYNDEATFQEQGIMLSYQDFKPKEYPQQFGEFIPGLSVLDALFNIGAEKVEEIVKSD